jgi:hypothetical protein
MWDWSSPAEQRAVETNTQNMRQYNLDMAHTKNLASMGGSPGGSGVQFGGLSGSGNVAGPTSPSYSNPYEVRLNRLLDNPDNIADTGAYKFRFAQGQQALERGAAAKGMTGSGNTLAALINYGQGAASQAYESERNALAQLTGQQNQFNLGQRGHDISAYGAQTSRMGTLGSLALSAQRAQADDYWRGKELTLKELSALRPPSSTGYSGGGLQMDRRGFW